MRVAICLGFLVLAGCSKGNSDESINSSIEEGSVSSSSVRQSTESSSGDLEVSNNSQSSEQAETKGTETKVNSKEYPYAVSLEELKTVPVFDRKGMNIPQTIELGFAEGAQGTSSFIIKGPEQDNVTRYVISYRQIPTKSIRVFSTNNNQIRTVQVNTELVLREQLSSDQDHEISGNLYVFTNKSGGLSLVTPNYAGNVAKEDSDIMLEYLPK